MICEPFEQATRVKSHFNIVNVNGGVFFRKIASIFVVTVGLFGCSNIQLTDAYNPKIEDSLNAYHQSLVTFVKKMEMNAGTSEGEYGNRDVLDFYASSDGVLANLVLRAQADNPKAACVPSKLIEPGLLSFVTKTNAEFKSTQNSGVGSASLDEVSQNDLSQLGQGSCTVVVLQGIRQLQNILQGIHKNETYLQPPASTIALDNMEDGIRIALTNETAKKHN